MNIKNRVLITGANGFIGSKLLARLISENRDIRAVIRSNPPIEFNKFAKIFVKIEGIGPSTEWGYALEGCDTVVHLAACTPAPQKSAEVYNITNAEGTRRLAQQATEAGVRKIVFLSSISAVVDRTAETVQIDGLPSIATTSYGLSKLVSEAHIADFANNNRTGICLRPPLVYDVEAKGNWRLLQRLARLHLPLPFGAVFNRRSLISRDNLVDAIVRVLDFGQPANSGAYCVAEEAPVSTTDILEWLRLGMERPRQLVPLPAKLLQRAFCAVGLSQISAGILGNLEIDSARFRSDFQWKEPIETRLGIIQAGARLRAGYCN